MLCDMSHSTTVRDDLQATAPQTPYKLTGSDWLITVSHASKLGRSLRNLTLLTLVTPKDRCGCHIRPRESI